MPKEKRACWFKMYLHQKSLIDAMPDEAVGAGFKAAMDYFDNGEIPQLDPLQTAIFAALKPFIDDATDQYARDVENGKKSAIKRKEVQGGSRGLKQKEKEEETETEEEAEEEKEEDKEKEKESVGISIKPAKAVSPTRFIPPDIDQVREYCNQKGYPIDPERFVDYYTSIGWKVGKNPMKDWKAAVRTWNTKDRKENQLGNTKSTPVWTIGTTL